MTCECLVTLGFVTRIVLKLMLSQQRVMAVTNQCPRVSVAVQMLNFPAFIGCKRFIYANKKIDLFPSVPHRGLLLCLTEAALPLHIAISASAASSCTLCGF